MNLDNKEEKLVNTIVGLYNKINDIKKEQLYIKSFEKDIDNSLKNLFPNLTNYLNKTGEFGDWTLEVLGCNSESEVFDVLDRMDICEQECLQEINFPKYTEETPEPIGDELKVIGKQVELLKHRFDDIIVYMKNLETEIVKLEKKLIDFSIQGKNHNHYE